MSLIGPPEPVVSPSLLAPGRPSSAGGPWSMGQPITSGVGTTPRLNYRGGSTGGVAPTAETGSIQPEPKPQEGGNADDNNNSNNNDAASSDPLRRLMDDAAKMSQAVRQRLRPDNILVDGEFDRWPKLEGVHKAVYDEFYGKRARSTVGRHVAQSQIRERQGLGNCGEMSTAVLRELVDYLLKHGMTDRRVDTIVRGDHEFVVIDPPRANQGGVPKDFSEWPKDSIIVDPWMGIVCPAHDYPTALRAKAEVWASENKTIGTTSRVVKNGRMEVEEKVMSPQEFVESVLNRDAMTSADAQALGSLESLKKSIDWHLEWIAEMYASHSKRLHPQ
ncbi:hypothetical protein OV079_03225 [Nannocystis pusilla]|uniref:Uncharacterized protein n=1 Tax=Nannocystis pusilla TaxID=889268 RepID=A0A9X3EIC6_9BACT|nr:hypothetical protein [Nannocystis pusilla]MCY1004597.1 hypothetical protein [Nannocystis pusilla]